jgi:hypothetical protein
MKKIFLLLLAFSAILFACNSNGDAKKNGAFNPESLLQNTNDTSKYTTIKWLDSVVNFGSVIRGAKVNVVFRFVNTGIHPLYIIYAKPGCGCTIVDFTKGAIMPGKQGEVTGQYDSNHGSPGEEIEKSISVTCNALNYQNRVNYTLVFKGMVR